MVYLSNVAFSLLPNFHLGWALTVELLSTAFQSGPFGENVCGIDRETGKPMPMPLGHYFLAIDIEKLCPLTTFKTNASNLLTAIRSSKKSPQGEGKSYRIHVISCHVIFFSLIPVEGRIWTAGELENEARRKRSDQGGLSVPYALQKDMISLRDRFSTLQMKYEKLPFE